MTPQHREVGNPEPPPDTRGSLTGFSMEPSSLQADYFTVRTERVAKLNWKDIKAVMDEYESYLERRRREDGL